jgi:ADP-heptose:LPS heptosyltransferase
VVFLGGRAESGLIEVALASMRQAGAPDAVVLCDALSLGELGAVIANADVLIANNSAPAHIAAAVGTPVVDLYALTNPQHTPWMAPSTVLSHEVPCRDCLRSVCPQGHHDCLRAIEPATVAEAAMAWLDKPDFSPNPDSLNHAARRIHATQEAIIE